MKVKVLLNLGRGWPALKEGEEAEVDSKMGKSLIDHGLATLVEEEKPKKKSSEPTTSAPAEPAVKPEDLEPPKTRRKKTAKEDE